MQVASPSAGAVVSSPFQVSATASVCQSQNVSTVGYALDDGANQQINGTVLSAQASATAGQHTLHVLAWGAGGATCEADVALLVQAPNATSPALPNPPTGDGTNGGPTIPQGAISVSAIQAQTNWKGDHDTESGPGTSTGAMTVVSSPSLSGSAREFSTSFTDYGGERYYATLGSDPSATHFLYDAWVYVVSPAANVANLEMDMNQVLANGQTVIYGFQCDGYSGTWDFTQNAGTPEVYVDQWIQTKVPCNVQNWTPDTWHHVQVTYSRDDSGNVTYQSVWFDGAEQDINQTVPSSFALGWSSVLLTNFQVDSRGASGSNTVYVDNLTITRW